MQLQLLSNIQGYLSGSIDGDGYSINYHNDKENEIVRRVGFTNTEESILSAFIGSCDHIGVKTSKIGTMLPSGREIYNVSISNKEGLNVLYSNLSLLVKYKQEALLRSVTDSFRDGELPLILCDAKSIEFRKGWLAGLFDSEGWVVRPPNYRLGISNTDEKVINYACESLELLGIECLVYWFDKKNCKDGIVKKPICNIIITKANAISIFSDLIPIQSEAKRFKLEEVMLWTTRQRTKYSNEELIELHINKGLSLSSMCRELGENVNSAGRLARQMRKAGVEVRSQVDMTKPRDVISTIEPLCLYKIYMEEGMNASKALLRLGIESSSNKLLNILQANGYEIRKRVNYVHRNGEILDPSLLPEVYRRLSLGESGRSILRSLTGGVATGTTKLLKQLEKASYDVSSYRRKK